MKWVQIRITTSQESADALSNFLFELEAKGINVEENDDSSLSVLTTYFVSDDWIDDRVNKLKKFMDKLQSVGLVTKPGSIELKSIENKNWVQESRSRFSPKRIGEHIVVAPTWATAIAAKPDDVVVRIDPGRAFGTGHHPTTSLSLQLLEKCIKGGETIADIGTGSGILSIAAVMLGARYVKAVDIDETAVSVARENVKLNGVDKSIDLSVSQSLTNINEKFDLIVANILTSIILSMIPQFSKHLESKGKIILSGITESETPSIEYALGMHDFELEEKLVSEEWVGILALNWANCGYR